MKRILLSLTAVALTFVSLGSVALADPLPLDLDPSKTHATDATFSFEKVEADTVLKIATAHAEPWPGVIVVPAKGRWNLGAFEYVQADLHNTGSTPVRINCRVDNPGADGRKNCVTAGLDLGPGKSGTLTIHMSRKGPTIPGVSLFGMRGYPIDMGVDGVIDPANVTQLVFFIAKPSEDHSFEIRRLRAVGDYQIPPDDLKSKPFLPFIDQFGQYIHREWPGKLHDASEFADRIKDEQRELSLFPGPPSWDKFGGWKDGPALDATGYFRVQKYKDKWTLVDPEGRLFFSHGIDCVNSRNSTPIDERESWFADFPGKLPENKVFFSSSKGLIGHYADRPVESFSFEGANLKRKYGEGFEKANIDVIHQRLRSWAINTLGNWSDKQTCLADRTPYVTSIWMDSRKIEGSKGYWSKFRDVFAPEFAVELKKRVIEFTAKTMDDPWCIGYFVDNEMS